MAKSTPLLIDGDLLVYRLASAAETEVDWGNDLWTLHSDAHGVKRMFASEVERIEKKFRTRNTTICFSDRNNFRKSLHPEYKSGRKGRKPLAYPAVVDWVRYNYNSEVWANLEADDVLGILASKDRRSVIVSWDKDMAQIPGRHYDPYQNLVTSVTEAGGYRHFLSQVLTGDRVDNYSGLPGCGPVKAAAILDKDESWSAVLEAYEKAGLTLEDAYTQARLAYILKRPEDYDNKLQRVNLWTPE
jgi:5'-3' exonuclease